MGADARILSISSPAGDVPNVSNQGSEYDRTPTPLGREEGVVMSVLATLRSGATGDIVSSLHGALSTIGLPTDTLHYLPAPSNVGASTKRI